MNKQTTEFIRQAEPSDAKSLAKLIDVAGEGIPNWLWTRACVEGQTPLEIGIERAKRKTGGFSYTNALVAEAGGNPIGMVLSYPITEAPTENPDDLPAPIAPFVALEKLSVNTWFINALAVFAERQNQGVGSQLLAAAEHQALVNGHDKMSIQVYGQNTGAVRLYERQGYLRVASEPVRLHPSPPYYTGEVLLLMKSLSTGTA
ncbi:GNAT family N-acetyltransferase [Ruegeria sp. R13_0]|uniref:GNAT family N-acetyltransferase n=1 Tax=Ruegeria sp. R13_0 TaxID=2821099 RepID=UPI001ADCA110|nr:GNAT family N-acetyltransferase [Ruegeria sp. R13_0]MBO9436868.1 GNAT family N-acetyltransferase [Ruegeria sp. R13_0]